MDPLLSLVKKNNLELALEKNKHFHESLLGGDSLPGMAGSGSHASDDSLPIASDILNVSSA